jgi:MFS family permease
MISLRCQGGLNSLNFLIGAIQTAFGPFFSVYLTQQGWSQADIGFVLSVGTASALILQIPAGIMVDAMHYKRLALAIAMVLLGISAFVVATAPSLEWMLTARVLQALASCLLTPAIAALTLVLCGHGGFSERLGSNGRYASLGSLLAAAVWGAIAYSLSERWVFICTTVLTVTGLATLLAFRASDGVEPDHPALLHPRERRARDHRPWDVFGGGTLHIFAACVLLFQFTNAAMLPLALNALSKRIPEPGLVVSAAIVVPQAVVVLFSPWGGRLAQSLGRRPMLLAGFAALPLRAILFMGSPDAASLVAIEILDGVSATVFGMIIPLIAADLTHGNGYLNLAIGFLGLAGGLGAIASTSAAGWLADAFGVPVAFLALALAGLAALAFVWRLMPETRPGKPFTPTPAVAAV